MIARTGRRRTGERAAEAESFSFSPSAVGATQEEEKGREEIERKETRGIGLRTWSLAAQEDEGTIDESGVRTRVRKVRWA